MTDNENKSVRLTIRLPAEMAEQLSQAQSDDPGFVPRVVTYGLARREADARYAKALKELDARTDFVLPTPSTES